MPFCHTFKTTGVWTILSNAFFYYHYNPNHKIIFVPVASTPLTTATSNNNNNNNNNVSTSDNNNLNTNITTTTTTLPKPLQPAGYQAIKKHRAPAPPPQAGVAAATVSVIRQSSFLYGTAGIGHQQHTQ